MRTGAFQFVPFLLDSYFVSSNIPFVKFTKGNPDNPGEFTFTYPLEIPKPEVTYQGKLVVIVNEETQSQAEYTAMAFIGVYYPDGRPTQRIGIIPDIMVKPTIKGIQEGRDELMGKAIEIINSGK